MPHTVIVAETADFEMSECLRLPEDALPDRLDKVLARHLSGYSRGQVQAWIEQGHVCVNGQTAKVRLRVGPGDEIRFRPQSAPEDEAFRPEPVAFSVVRQTDHWIVVDKPAGLVTHPGAGNWQGTLLNGLLYRYPELIQVPRAGIVHRLDKETSGLLVVARTEWAQQHLVEQLRARTVHREYAALAQGRTPDGGCVDAPIGRDPRVPVRRTVHRPVAPKPARTHYRTVSRGWWDDGAVSYLCCRLETGRTHQIRVHLASLGHPLLGDRLYGAQPSAQVSRQMLHARRLRFQDPQTGAQQAVCAPLPDDFQRALAAIEWEEGRHADH